MQISKATTSVEGAIKLRCRNCLSTELARLDDAETAEALDSKVYSKSVGRGGWGSRKKLSKHSVENRTPFS